MCSLNWGLNWNECRNSRRLSVSWKVLEVIRKTFCRFYGWSWGGTQNNSSIKLLFFSLSILTTKRSFLGIFVCNSSLNYHSFLLYQIARLNIRLVVVQTIWTHFSQTWTEIKLFKNQTEVDEKIENWHTNCFMNFIRKIYTLT